MSLFDGKNIKSSKIAGSFRERKGFRDKIMENEKLEVKTWEGKPWSLAIKSKKEWTK